MLSLPPPLSFIIYIIQKDSNIQISFKNTMQKIYIYFISLRDIIKIQCWCSTDLARCLIYCQDMVLVPSIYPYIWNEKGFNDRYKWYLVGYIKTRSSEITWNFYPYWVSLCLVIAFLLVPEETCWSESSSGAQ